MNPTIATDALDNAVGRNAENTPGDSGNIFLIGMMGAGKTTIAKLVAGLLEKTVYDCDREIQKKTGVSIPVIFEIEGESWFSQARNRNALRTGEKSEHRAGYRRRSSAERGKPRDAQAQRHRDLFAGHDR